MILDWLACRVFVKAKLSVGKGSAVLLYELDITLRGDRRVLFSLFFFSSSLCPPGTVAIVISVSVLSQHNAASIKKQLM